MLELISTTQMNVILQLFENYWLTRIRPLIGVGQRGRRWLEVADSNPDRLDHQVALIAQSVEHRSTNPRVVGSIPTQVNKIFQSFPECV